MATWAYEDSEALLRANRKSALWFWEDPILPPIYPNRQIPLKWIIYLPQEECWLADILP